MNEDKSISSSNKPIVIVAFIIIISFVVIVFNIKTQHLFYKDPPFENKIDLSLTNQNKIANLSDNFIELPNDRALFISPEGNSYSILDLQTLKVLKIEQVENSLSHSKLKVWNNFTLAFLSNGNVVYIDNSSHQVFKELAVTKIEGEFIEVFDHYAVISDYRRVALIDLITGTAVYEKEVGEIGQMKYADGYLIYTQDFGRRLGHNIYVLDVLTFAERWKYEQLIIGSGYSRIFIDKKIVAFNSSDRAMFFDLLSGKIIADKKIQADSVKIINNKVYFDIYPANQLELICTGLDLNVLWTRKNLTGPMFSKDGYIYATSPQSTMSKINAQTGHLIWTIKVEDLATDSIETGGKYNVLCSASGNVYLLDKETGIKQWRYDLRMVNNDKSFMLVNRDRLYIYDGELLKMFYCK